MKAHESQRVAPGFAGKSGGGRWVLVIVLVAMICGGALRLTGIDRIGLEGSDNTYYTNIAQHWSEGDRVQAIGDDTPLYRPVVYAVFGLAVRLLGFDDSSIKTVNAVIDIGNILLVFLLAFILSRRNPRIAMSAAVVYSFLPFTILISRSEQTHILSTTTVLTATILIALSWSATTRTPDLVLVGLAGLATGLSALTHEELIFTAAGPCLILLFRPPFGPDGIRTRLISAASRLGTYLSGIFLAAGGMLLTHQADAQGRASEIAAHSIAHSRYLGMLERPFKYGWNAITGTGSTVMACLVIALVLVLLVRVAARSRRSRFGRPLPTPFILDLPLWTIICHLIVYSWFFSYYATRLFVPLIPLLIVWLFVRVGSLIPENARPRTRHATLALLTVTLVVADLGHFAGVQKYLFSHFRSWSPFSVADDLRPDLGWSELRRRTTSQSWARQRFDELGDVVTEESRLLVGASIFHPFPGRRVLQVGYYFGDDAVHLFDHDQPLDRLIDDKNIEFVLFTTHQTYDRRAIDWEKKQRYQYQGRWGPRASHTLGASLGFSDGEYTIEGEFERLRAAMTARGARIIYGWGELLKKRPAVFSSVSYVVWTLDPTGWAPLEEETEAVSLSLEQALGGMPEKALTTLEAAEAHAQDLGRFRLRLAGARILAEHDRPDETRRQLAAALSLLPRDTTVCTALSDVFPTSSAAEEAFQLFSEFEAPPPNGIAIRRLLLALAVNLTDLVLESEDWVGSINAFQRIERLLETPGDRRFTLSIADWCASRARLLAQEGHSRAAAAGLSAASTAYMEILTHDDQPPPFLLVTAGRTLSDTDRHDEAVVVLRRASTVDPTNPKVWSNLCLALSRAGDDERGLEACAKALRIKPGDTLAATLTAQLLGRTGRSAEATKQTVKLLSRSNGELNHPREVELVETVARTIIGDLIARGDTLLAVKLSTMLGRFLSDRGRHDPASEVLLNAVHLAPGFNELWANLCLVYQRTGQTDAALESCRQAIELNPDHFWARMITAEVLASEGRWPDAIREARGAAILPPSFGGHADRLISLAREAAENGYGGQACNLLLTIEGPDSRAVDAALESLGCADR